ncbi:MAG: hypothetical protein RLN74_00365, partial [Ilumatobacter fluminis]
GTAPVTQHTIQFVDAGAYDPSEVDIVVTRLFNDGDTAATGIAPTDVDMTANGLTLPFEAGAKYEIDVTLPSYGSLTGTIDSVDGNDDPVPICTDLTTPATQATVTAVPVVPFDDGINPPTWRLDTSGNRTSIVTVTECGGDNGDFVLIGKSGAYAVAVDHPEFVSSRTLAALNTLLANGSLPINSIDAVVEIPVSGSTTVPVPITETLPDLTIRQTPVDLRAFEALDGVAATGVFFVIRDSGGDVEVAPSAVNQTAVETTLDPDTYTIEFRGCLAAPADVTAFDACDLRFPVSVAVTIDRTAPNPAAITVDVEVVQVGGEITTTMLFENSRNRPVCPSDTYQVDRDFDADFAGCVDGADTTLVVDSTLRDESIDIVVQADGATTQSNCIAQSGRFSATFDEWIPTGTHTVTLPVVDGYGAPTLTWDPDTGDATPGTSISGTAVGTTGVAFD